MEGHTVRLTSVAQLTSAERLLSTEEVAKKEAVKRIISSVTKSLKVNELQRQYRIDQHNETQALLQSWLAEDNGDDG